MKFLLALLLVAGSAHAAQDQLEAIKKELIPFTALKGHFEQSKKIKIIKNPLKSYGDFMLAKNQGLIWRSTRPLKSTIRITKDDIASLNDGKKVIFVSMKDQPALGVIGKILFAIFGADIDELQRHFEFAQVHYQKDTSLDVLTPNNLAIVTWNVTLKPIDPSIAKVITYVDISGGKIVHRLTLFEANGDSTEIQFKEVSSRKPLTKEEEALFE